MLRLSLSLLPQGNAGAARDLGVLEIANIGGTPERGDYAVTLRGTVHADATLRAVPRDQAHWPLVRAAVNALFPGETPAARIARLKATPGDQLTPDDQADLTRAIEAEMEAELAAGRAKCAAEGHAETDDHEGDLYCRRCGLLLDEDGNGPDSIPDMVMASRSGGML